MWSKNQKGSSIYWAQPLHQVWYWSSEGVKGYWADNTVSWEEWFILTFDQNSGLSSVSKQKLFKASKQRIKIYKGDNTLGSKKWFDLVLWTSYLKINRDHLFLHQVWYWSSEGVKRYWAKTLGLQTDRPTDRNIQTDRRLQTICPLFQKGGGGIIK